MVEWGWGLLRPVLGSIIGFLERRLGQDRERDILAFKKLDAIASESRIDDILNGRVLTATFRLEDRHTLSDLVEALRRIENRFLDNQLQLKAEELARVLNNLLALIGQTLWPIPGGFLKFRPDPIDSRVYDSVERAESESRKGMEHIQRISTKCKTTSQDMNIGAKLVPKNHDPS